jgi:hypothetical protein
MKRVLELSSIALSMTMAGAGASASELSYTYVDFRVLSSSVDGSGSQSPTPNQQVAVDLGDGDGVSVAGSLALPGRFYLVGAFNSSIIDVRSTITSPLTEVVIDDEFDLITSSFGIGYQRELARNFDLTLEVAYERGELDFGSLAGENFDTENSGTAARLGFRWNPREPLEVFASAGPSPYGKLLLDERRFDSGTVVNAGLRWYFFPDLGVGLDYQSGDLSSLTLSMRFSFGNLPW